MDAPAFALGAVEPLHPRLLVEDRLQEGSGRRDRVAREIGKFGGRDRLVHLHGRQGAEMIGGGLSLKQEADRKRWEGLVKDLGKLFVGKHERYRTTALL